MSINRLASYTPPANLNSTLHISERNAVVSVLATNRSSTTDATIRIWVKPDGTSNEQDFSYIAYDVLIPKNNTLETFKFAINDLDTVFVRSSTASVAFTLNGIYESNGTSNISVGSTPPTNPQIGDVFVDTVNNNVLYWTGTNWFNGTADTTLYPFPVYASSSPTTPIVGQLWIDSDSIATEITEDQLVPVSSGSTTGKYLVSDGNYPNWQTLEKELPAYTSASSSFLKTSANGQSLLWTANVAPLEYPQFVGFATASTVPQNDVSTRLATTEWVSNKGYLTSSAALAFAAPKYDPVFFNSLTVPVTLANGYLYALSSGSVVSNIPTITIGSSIISANSASTSLTGLGTIAFTDNTSALGKQILYTGYFNGVESNTYYWRSAGNTFRWYLNVTPDQGTTDKMELNSTGLAINGTVAPTSLTPIAGTTSVAPIVLTSGTNLSSFQNGAFEYDGNTIYLTKNSTSGRASADASIITTTTTDLTLSNVNTAQSIFPAANDTLTNISASTTYLVEGIIYVSTTGTTSNALQLGFDGTATYTSLAYDALVTENATGFSTLVPTATYSSRVTTATATSVTNAVATATYRTVRIYGIIRTNAAGTFIPQLTYTAAPGVAPVVAADSYLRLNAIGNSTVASIGAWG